MTSAIEVRDLEKSYGETRAVDGVSLSVAVGEFFGLLGPKGAGKTTVLAAAALPDAGSGVGAARVVVTVAIALVQMAVFLHLATSWFGWT